MRAILLFVWSVFGRRIGRLVLMAGEELDNKVHLCEWERCMRAFPSRRLLMHHIGSFHIASQDQSQV